MSEKIRVIVITKNREEIEAWLECKDHGQDLQFYRIKDKTRIANDKIISWMLPYQLEG